MAGFFTEANPDDLKPTEEGIELGLDSVGVRAVLCAPYYTLDHGFCQVLRRNARASDKFFVLLMMNFSMEGILGPIGHGVVVALLTLSIFRSGEARLEAPGPPSFRHRFD